VKLHHNPNGHVQILSVAPYKSFPNSPSSRTPHTGDVRAGDVILDVGDGAWDLREPIKQEEWSALVRYIREAGRPLSMVVAEGDWLKAREEEENEERWARVVKSQQEGGDDAHGEGDEKSNDELLEVPKSDDTSQRQTEEACKSDDDRFSIEFNALQVEVGKDII
jgi:hypothetical protein